ncbi:glycosyltransferase [Candidatus Pacearchaeota archaeon]|nr:glycosyltransferase [Candidatus Pacearchaeota archaeon]
MRIAIISDAMYPTPYEHGHGLGRSAYNLAKNLKEFGYPIVLFGCEGSHLDGATVITVPRAFDGRDEFALRVAVVGNDDKFDVAVDMSHTHCYATAGRKPTIADFQDREGYLAHNAVFPSEYIMKHVGRPGEVIYNGVDVKEFPLYEGPKGKYLLFMGSDIWHKGLNDARRVAEKAGIELLEFGSGCKSGFILGEGKAMVYQRAIATLCPYSIDAGPNVVLESLSCGTPVIAFNRAAMPEYVLPGSGFIVDSVEEMVKAVSLVRNLKPSDVALAIPGKFDIITRANAYEDLLIELINGKRW